MRAGGEGGANVYALFPGIDTTPFGIRAERQQVNDQGWSAVPERTISEGTEPHRAGYQDTAPEATNRVVTGRRLRLGRALTLVAIAVLAGGILGSARVLLITADHRVVTAKSAIRLATTSPTRSRTVASRTAASKPRVRSRSEHRTVIHRTIRRGRYQRAHHPITSRTTRSTKAPSAATSPQPSAAPISGQPVASATTQPASEPVSSGSTHTQSSSSAPARPAGPTGRVSLIGAGTTPGG